MIHFTRFNGAMVPGAHTRSAERLASSVLRSDIPRVSSSINGRRCRSITTLTQRLNRTGLNSIAPVLPLAVDPACNVIFDTSPHRATSTRKIAGLAQTRDAKDETGLVDFGKQDEQHMGNTGEQSHSPHETGKSLSANRGQHLGSSVSKKAIQLELRWVRDRVALARRISGILAKDDLEKASALLLAAEKEHIDCIVGWNLVFQKLMVNGRPFDAFKLYNDMKKRGLVPNSRTYTIMFHGFAQSPSPNAVTAALSIYRSLTSSKSKAKPSVIHHNAILSVCARHGRMDSLWEMASELPETGQANGPDAATFTVILQALRASCEQEVSRLNPWNQADDILKKRRETVNEAKRIWADIVSQWKKGQLMIDNPLVLAMGRILASTGQEKDYYDMFTLYHQTMRIPLLKSLRSQFNYTANQDSPQEDESKSTLPLSPSDIGSSRHLTKQTEGLFDPPDFEDIRLKAEKTYDQSIPEVPVLRPQNEDLALIIEACKQMPNHLGISIGKDYWDSLTAKKGKWKIDPDAISSHQYLRLLREARSSQETLRLIKDVMASKGELFPKTFIIALSTCSRDKKNPNIFTIASQIIDLMYLKLLAPDPRVIIRYVELVSAFAKSPAQLEEMVKCAHASESRNPKPKDEQRAYLLVHTEALRHIRPHIRRIFQVLQYGTVQCPDRIERPPKQHPDAAVDMDFPGMLKVLKYRKHNRRQNAVHIELNLAQSLSTLSYASKLINVVLNSGRSVLKEKSRPWFKKEAERLYRTALTWQKEKLAADTTVSLWVDGDSNKGVKELEQEIWNNEDKDD